MKRYAAEEFMYVEVEGVMKVVMVEAPEGELVKYDEALAEIERKSEIYIRRIRELKQGNWVERRIKEAGWEDKEVYRAIGDEGHHLITFTDASCLISGDIIDGKWSIENG